MGAILFPVLFLAVKGAPIGVLLVHRPRNSGCRGKAFPNQGRRNLGLYDHRFFYISKAFFAGGASITLAVVFNDFTCGWNEFQFPADILLADQDHLRAADWTDLFFFWKRDDYFFHPQTFEEIIMGCFLFTGMLPDHSLFFQQGRILFYFCFIKKILLSWNVIGSSFAG